MQWRDIRSVFETPVLDDRKWAKLPDIPFDAFMLDLEDTVPAHLKDEARQRVVEHLRTPDLLGGRPVVARPNALGSPHFDEDVEALAGVGVAYVTPPKVNDADELREILDRFAAHGCHPEVVAIIETPGAVIDLARIATMPEVRALNWGPFDYAVETGILAFDEDGGWRNEPFIYPRSKIVTAAAAFGLGAIEPAFITNLKDLDLYARRVRQGLAFGITTIATFYPPHVQVIHDAFAPDEAELAEALDIIGAYEEATRAGHPAVVHRGKVLIPQDHKIACRTRDAAARWGVRQS